MLWRSIQEVAAAGDPLDPVVLADHMSQRGSLGEVGGFGYLAQLAKDTPSAANVAAYAQVVVQRAIERDWITVGQEIADIMYTGGDTHQDRVNKCQALVTAMASEKPLGSMQSLREVLKEYVDHLEWRHDNPGIHGLRTGFKHIDYRTQGMQPGNLVVIGARPAMGKTAYMLNIMRQASTDPEQRAAGVIFSLEMANSELAQRVIAAQEKIQLGLLKSAKVLDHKESLPRLSAAIAALADVDVHLDDSASLTAEDIIARARRQHRVKPLAFVIVDHLALIDASDRRHNETDRIAHATRMMKKLAKELGCVVIVLSQLNREVEKRQNKRPLLSDLRSSGAIEQDADIIQFLYRDEYYNENTQHRGIIEVITAKLRDGEIGTDYLTWLGQYNRMDSIDRPGGQPAAPAPVESPA